MISDLAVVLYGSVARGDSDSISDVDILVVGPIEAKCDKRILKKFSDGRPVNVSHYTWQEFGAMSESGSLFIKHLAMESRPIEFFGNGEKRYLDALVDLASYRFVERDLRSFQLGVEDCRCGINSGSAEEFELAVLGGIARHASVLACYLVGEVSFGRSSITKACELLGLQKIASTLVLAHRFRLYERHQCGRPQRASKSDVHLALDACDELLDAMGRIRNG